MRVHVPFGKGNRLVQGIIIESVDEEEEGLKEIAELLDLEPVLTKEQLRLADEMRHTVFSYKISCLKAMLPNLLNSSYDKILTNQEGIQTKWSALSESQKVRALKDVKSGKLSVNYSAKSKENKKTEKYLKANAKLATFEIGKAAKKEQN